MSQVTIGQIGTAPGTVRHRETAGGDNLCDLERQARRARDAVATRAGAEVGYRSGNHRQATAGGRDGRNGSDVAASTGDAPQGAGRLGFTSGQVVQEFGYDDDADEALRSAVEEITGTELVDEEFDDVVDGVVIWHRDDDGDLADTLVDALTVLDDGGLIWVLTPKAGRAGHVGHDDIQEAGTTAGLHATSTFSIAEDWSATRLGSRGRGR